MPLGRDGKNPYAYRYGVTPGPYEVRFDVLRKQGRERLSLVWSGSGFKNPNILRYGGAEFPTKQAAEAWIEAEGMPFIAKWRAEDHDYIRGWELPVSNPRRRNAGFGPTPAVGSPPRDVLGPEDYPGIFSDPDEDTLPTADDADPFRPSTQRIEEGSLAGEVANLLRLRQGYVHTKNAVMQGLVDLGVEGSIVKGRVKAPVSILNKLIRKRLGTLTDLAGTAITVPNERTLWYVVGQIRDGKLGQVREEEDHYETSTRFGRGYKAVHFLVERDGAPVEVQVKTSRQSALADLAHGAYKFVRPGSPEERDFNTRLKHLSDQAQQADQGNLDAAVSIDTALASPEALADWIAHGR